MLTILDFQSFWAGLEVLRPPYRKHSPRRPHKAYDELTACFWQTQNHKSKSSRKFRFVGTEVDMFTEQNKYIVHTSVEWQILTIEAYEVGCDINIVTVSVQLVTSSLMNPLKCISSPNICKRISNAFGDGIQWNGILWNMWFAEPVCTRFQLQSIEVSDENSI